MSFIHTAKEHVITERESQMHKSINSDIAFREITAYSFATSKWMGMNRKTHSICPRNSIFIVRLTQSKSKNVHSIQINADAYMCENTRLVECQFESGSFQRVHVCHFELT